MGVGVDEARQNEHVFEVQGVAGLPVLDNFGGGADCGNQTLVDGQRGLFYNAALLVLSDDAGGMEQCVAVAHAFLHRQVGVIFPLMTRDFRCSALARAWQEFLPYRVEWREQHVLSDLARPRGEPL